MAAQKPIPNPTAMSISDSLSGTAIRLQTGKTHPICSRTETPKPTEPNRTGSGHPQADSHTPSPLLTHQRSLNPASPVRAQTCAGKRVPTRSTRSNTPSRSGTTRRARLRLRRRRRIREASFWERESSSVLWKGQRGQALPTRPSWRVRRGLSDR